MFRMLRFLPASLLVCGLLLASGCDPKCRESRPVDEALGAFAERIDDRLDAVDVGDEPRAKINAMLLAKRPSLVRMRAATFPVQRQIVAELKQPVPNRARLHALIEQNVAFGASYFHEYIETMLAAHALLTPDQRKALAKYYSKPSPPFEGSFLIDRGIDLFLIRISATDEQRQLVLRIKGQLEKRWRALQREADALRFATVAEFAKDEPDRARIEGAFQRGRAMALSASVEMTGYYLLVQSKLDPGQRVMLDTELLRFEPCPEPGEPRAAAASPPAP
jgi:Spy/CpxP family protein refolding chaperone